MNTKAEFILAGGFVLSLYSSALADDGYNPNLLDNDLTIIENAAKLPELSTFVEALMASDLAEELMGEGPYTVFAPSNEAFEMLPDETLSELLRPENSDELTAILRLHVLTSPLQVADMEAVTAIGDDHQSDAEGSDIVVADNGKGAAVAVETLHADDHIMIDQIAGQVYLQPAEGGEDSATILIPDIMAQNGIIHIINRVMTP